MERDDIPFTFTDYRCIQQGIETAARHLENAGEIVRAIKKYLQAAGAV